MTPEELKVHRDLQYLRAAGRTAANRRGRRRNSIPHRSQASLVNWVGERHRKLREAT